MLETRCEQSQRLQLSKRIVRISEGGIAHLCEYMHGSQSQADIERWSFSEEHLPHVSIGVTCLAIQSSLG